MQTFLRLILVVLVFPVFGAEQTNEAGAFGHSIHGEAFDEGPRQAAYLMEGMPAIDFPVSSENLEARKFFEQGVGQLHGFWYFEAERSFRQVAQLDTNCVMAYWGLAMANVQNEKRAKQFMEKAVKLTNGLPRRELLYLDSLATFHLGDEKNDVEKHRKYVKALEQIVEEFPDDLEAKTFLAFKIWENNGRIKISSHVATDALAREVLAVKPLHPVNHLRIHLWNYEADRRALESAARCGQGSPGIAHMWHMPGHTFSGLNRYADAAWQQEASARVDHAYMMRNQVLPDQIHNYAHNNEWLVRTLSHLGRVSEATDLAKNLIELPRHPKYNAMEFIATKEGKRKEGPSGSARLGRARLIETLIRWELWDELIALGNTMYLEPTAVPEEQGKRAYALALAYFGKGDLERAEEQMEAVEAAIGLQREARHEDVDHAELDAKDEKKPDDEMNKAMSDALQPHTARIRRLENLLAELKVQRAIANGETNKLRELVDALKEVPKERIARMWIEIGENEKAVEAAREAVKNGTNQVQLLANYVEILSRTGHQQEAEEQFATLRRIGSQAPLELPIMQRLSIMAREMDLPEDWREPFVPSTDSGERPPLGSLGPFRWQPSTAPEWALRDAENREVRLQDFQGRPVVVLFYLGAGCLHCIEQLNAFAPKVKDFSDAGISIVAVSTESVSGLKETLGKGTGGEPFPFPIVSDEDLATFRAYRAYDDFEKMPLHGSFLVDGRGTIRWQDISFEPFSDVDFLLKESKRLLTLPDETLFAKARGPKRMLSPRAAAPRN